MSKSLKCWLGLHLVAWLGTALSVLLLAAAVALLRPLSLQYLSLWSMTDVSTALAGLAAAAGAALVAWHALGAMWVLVCACTNRTLNLRHSAPLVRKLATGAAIIALSCAPASANDDNLGWGAHGPGPSPSATASASASARPSASAKASASAKPSASAKASAPATASSPSRSPHASSAPTSRASATPTSHASARARASASASASPRPNARPSASPSRSSAHPRSGGPGSKTPAVKSPGAKSPNSKASPKSGSLKPGSAQRSGTCVPAPDAKPAPVIRQHLVLAGESLWSISLQWLQQNGVPSPTNGQVAQLSKQIFAANAALIGANPDLIRPGLALTIPTKG